MHEESEELDKERERLEAVKQELEGKMRALEEAAAEKKGSNWILKLSCSLRVLIFFACFSQTRPESEDTIRGSQEYPCSSCSSSRTPRRYTS